MRWASTRKIEKTLSSSVPSCRPCTTDVRYEELLNYLSTFTSVRKVSFQDQKTSEEISQTRSVSSKPLISDKVVSCKKTSQRCKGACGSGSRSFRQNKMSPKPSPLLSHQKDFARKTPPHRLHGPWTGIASAWDVLEIKMQPTLALRELKAETPVDDDFSARTSKPRQTLQTHHLKTTSERVETHSEKLVQVSKHKQRDTWGDSKPQDLSCLGNLERELEQTKASHLEASTNTLSASGCLSCLATP